MPKNIYHSLFENSSSIKLIIHPGTGKIIDANKAACSFYGYDKSKLVNMHIQDINLLSEEEVKKEMQDAKSEKRDFFKFQHRLADGQLRDVEVFSGPLIIHNEQLLYSIIHDVTERNRIENQITLERQFSESLINSLPGVMYVFDQLGHFKRWNSNFESVTCYTSNQIKKMNFIDFIAPEDQDRVREAIKKVFTEGSADVEASFSTLSGDIIPYLLTGYKFTQHDINYLVGVGLNISDRVIIENKNENLIAKLQQALSQVKLLSGFLPICASCKKIRDDKGYWNQIESYITKHSEVEFSHGICPECAKKLYPNLYNDNSDSHHST